MRTAGVIVEYNPLHNGHVHHLEQTRALSGADAVVAVMSGHFLQRGEPAVVNKWARAEMALRSGADLVLELPVAYAVQPAEWFAFGAVSALHFTGVVDALCFGSESGTLDWMLPLARKLAREPASLRAALQAGLKAGLNYPAAFTAAAAALAPDVPAAWLAQPNNTLGLHYLIALERLNSPIEPLTIPRIKAGYNEAALTDRRIASATALRRRIELNEGRLDPALADYMPPGSYAILEREFREGRGPVTWESFARPLFHTLMTATAEELRAVHEVTEGLEYRILKAMRSLDEEYFPSVERLLTALKTRRYTRTKLQRMLTRILLQHRKPLWDAAALGRGVPYLRVLGFTRTGRELLKRMKRTAAVPVVTRVAQADESPFLELDIRASSVYALAYQQPRRRDVLRDYAEPPLRLD
jgi:predicted nucleotidyltransferase